METLRMKKTIKSRTGRSVSGLSGPSDAERFFYGLVCAGTELPSYRYLSWPRSLERYVSKIVNVASDRESKAFIGRTGLGASATGLWSYQSGNVKKSRYSTHRPPFNTNAAGRHDCLLQTHAARIPAAPSCPRPDVRAGGPGFAIERACDCTRGGIETLALGLSLKQCKPPGEIATSRNTARTESGRVQSTFYTQLWR